MARYACAFLRGVGLAHHLRAQPQLNTCPVALIGKEGRRDRALAVNAAAAAAGLAVGTMASDAKLLCPEVILVPTDPAAEASYLATVGEALWALGPQVYPLGRDALLVEVGGSAHLFSGERGLLRAMRARLERWALRPRLALASDWLVARVLAEHGPRDDLILPAEEVSGTLSSQPVHVLLAGLEGAAHQAAAEVLGWMARLGVHRVRDLAALEGVFERFGASGKHLHERARGEPQPLPPALRLVPKIREELDWLDGPRDGPQLRHVLQTLLDRVVLRLRARMEAARVLTLELRWETGPGSRIPLRLGSACRCPRRLRSLLYERWARFPDPGKPILGLALEVEQAERWEGAQSDWVLAAERRGEALADVVERLRASLGEERVFFAVEADRHRPEAAWTRRDVPGADERALEESRPARPLVLLSAPEPLKGPPWRWRGQRVVAWGEWERISGSWWQPEESFDRDYRVAHTHAGVRLWLCRLRGARGWAVAGIFD